MSQVEIVQGIVHPNAFSDVLSDVQRGETVEGLFRRNGFSADGVLPTTMPSPYLQKGRSGIWKQQQTISEENVAVSCLSLMIGLVTPNRCKTIQKCPQSSQMLLLWRRCSLLGVMMDSKHVFHIFHVLNM